LLHHHHHHHHHHNSSTHRDYRRRPSHQSLSPGSPPHLDEMDVSSDGHEEDDDDDSRSVTSDSHSSRISREDETSALDSLTKLSSTTTHMAELTQKAAFISREHTRTPSLLVAIAQM